MSVINPSNVRQARKVNDIKGELRVDQYLTNFSLAYRQAPNNFITRRASTPIPVLNESDKFAIYPRGYFWRDEAEVRPLGGRPVQVGYNVENGQYLAEEWALEHTIDDRQRRNAAAPFDLDESGVMLLEGKQLIREDRIWAQQVFNTGVWANDYVGGTDFATFDDQTGDPVATMTRYKRILGRGSGFRANTIVLGARVIDALTVNPAMIDRVKYGGSQGIVDEGFIARAFGFQNVLVAESMYNAGAEGAADDFQYIVDEDAFWIGYVEPAPRMDSPTAIARFAWTGLIPGVTNALGGVITRGRDDRAYSDWIHSRNAFDIKVVAPDLGLYFTGAVTVDAG